MTQPDLFDAFWQLYPRRVGKLAARKAWERAKVTPAVFAQMQAALAWQIPQWQDVRYIPHPRTWLSQGRWLDEVPRQAEVPVEDSRPWFQRVCPHEPVCSNPAECAALTRAKESSS